MSVWLLDMPGRNCHSTQLKDMCKQSCLHLGHTFEGTNKTTGIPDFMHFQAQTAGDTSISWISELKLREFLVSNSRISDLPCTSLSRPHEISFCEAARSLCHHSKSTNKYTCMHGLATIKESTCTNWGSGANQHLLFN